MFLAVFGEEGPRTKAPRHKKEDREVHTKSTKEHKEPIVGRVSSATAKDVEYRGFA